ncbi:hypothetical protein Hanom_Chr06g00479681 [Helianthus anomalus]
MTVNSIFSLDYNMRQSHYNECYLLWLISSKSHRSSNSTPSMKPKRSVKINTERIRFDSSKPIYKHEEI